MSIQLDLTTTMPCQNFDSTQGHMTLQDHRVVDVDNNIAKIFGYSTREELLDNIDFVYALVPNGHQSLAKKRYLEAIKCKLNKGKVYTDIPVNGRNISVFCLSHVIELKPYKLRSLISHKWSKANVSVTRLTGCIGNCSVHQNRAF